jgi:hypothetical protein
MSPNDRATLQPPARVYPLMPWKRSHGPRRAPMRRASTAQPEWRSPPRLQWATSWRLRCSGQKTGPHRAYRFVTDVVFPSAAAAVATECERTGRVEAARHG